MFWNPWFVDMGFEDIAHSPSVALVVTKIVPAGKSLAELFFNPSLVIFLSVLWIYIVDSLVISVGTAHKIVPFQYFLLLESGVPPPVTFPISEIFFNSHSSGMVIILSNCPLTFLSLEWPILRVVRFCIMSCSNPVWYYVHVARAISCTKCYS